MWSVVYLLVLLGLFLDGSLADYDSFYSYYDDEDTTALHSSTGWARLRRNEDPVTMRTLNPQEIEEVEGALKEIMGGRDSDDLFSDKYSSFSATNDHEDKNMGSRHEYNRVTPLFRSEYDRTTPFIKADVSFTPSVGTEYVSATATSFVETENVSFTPFITNTDTDTEYDSAAPMFENEYDGFTPSRNVNSDYNSSTVFNTVLEKQTNMYVKHKPTEFVAKRMFSKMPSFNLSKVLRQNLTPAQNDYPTPSQSTTTTATSTTSTTSNARRATRTKEHKSTTKPILKHRKVTSTKRTTFQFNVEKFLEILANLTYDYDTNLVNDLNRTLIEHKVPTCGPLTTTELLPSDVRFDYSELNHTVGSKCFVCGLTARGVPYDANCADAFSVEFIPILKVDTRAKQYITTYRKYCRYMDVDNYHVNRSMPRSIFGRWTGGCSVRWTDLSGIYTQRSCRNRHHATTGHHYASKRMAKLEMALKDMDNGCIISPVASLVPLSRGVSLFARFHACVCTGNFCNKASRDSDIDMRLTFISAVLAIYFWLNDVR